MTIDILSKEMAKEGVKNTENTTKQYEQYQYSGLCFTIIKDKELPTGNWDDYYTQILEQACDLAIK